MTDALWLVATWALVALASAACSIAAPITRSRWMGRGSIHVVVALTVIVGAELARVATGGAIRGAPPWVGAPDPPSADAAADLISGARRTGPPPLARFGLGVLLYSLVASAVHASRRARDRERRALQAEARLAQAQLAALQAQLNPHFLFNSLNGVSALMHSDLAAADRMLGDLSELLRLALDAADTAEVPLHRELAFLDRYLAIEQTRFGDRLRVEHAIDAHVLDAAVPTLLLQPLVENAIKHGIEPFRAPGVVRLAARRVADMLEMSITDSGSRAAGTSPPSGHGIGLRNTRARLSQLYPDSFEFTIDHQVPSGTVVRVALPYRTTLAAPEGPSA